MRRVDGLVWRRSGSSGYVCKRLAETGERGSACTCSSDKYDRADVDTVCVACCYGEDSLRVGTSEDSCRGAEDETCVRWQVANVKDGPGQPILLSSGS